jgi:hypothetical protein
MLTTVDGKESAIARIYGLFRFNEQGRGEGIIVAVFNTNSTGKLAPLDGMIVAGTTELHPDATGLVRVWEWHSTIPYVKMPPTTTTMEGRPSSSMNNTNSSTTGTITANDVPPTSSS